MDGAVAFDGVLVREAGALELPVHVARENECAARHGGG